jgi:hypothetical protein
MKIRLITILIVVLVFLLAILFPTVIALAEKPDPIPHHNIPGKTVPANCHSKHAREAGVECNTADDDTDNGTEEEIIEPTAVPNSQGNPLPKHGTEPEDPAVTTAPVPIMGLLWGCGGGSTVHHMM